MDIKISSQFAADFKTVSDSSLYEKMKNILNKIKEAKTIDDLSQFRKIEGNDHAYRMGIGFYYVVGYTTSVDELTLMRLVHRDKVLNITK